MLNAEWNHWVIVIEDPLSTPNELVKAYEWFEDKVWDWKADNGLLTWEDFNLHWTTSGVFTSSFGITSSVVYYDDTVGDSYTWKGKKHKYATSSTGPK